MNADRAEASALSSRPVIVVSGRHLNQVASDAWQALQDCNKPPWVFRHGTYVARIDHDDEEQPVLKHLGFAALRGTVDRVAIWVSQGKGEHLTAVNPPKEVIEDMLALEKPLPPLRGLTGTPVFAADGTLVSSPGYHDVTRLYYEPLGDPIPVVPEVPSRNDLERAKSLILDEWLFDFPFVDESSSAHAVAAAVTHIAREFIAGPTPLEVIDAPTEGTGKGFLVRSLGIVLSGREPSPMTEGRGEEESRKRITAALRDGNPIIFLDNVKYPLDTAALASVLTTTEWTDRVLGKSETIRLPNRGLWLATGNNVALGSEIARRSVWIRLDSRSDRPWERTGFKHDPFLPWVSEHRHELVWALLVLVRNWVMLGRPGWEGRVLGSFEDWCRAVGGILTAAGIDGFLENREELYRRVDAEGEEWREFVGCWWDKHGAEPVKTGELYDLVREWDLLSSVFRKIRDGATDRALRTAFGIALRQRRDRRFGRYFVRHLGQDTGQKGALYQLELAEEAAVVAAEPPSSDGQGSAEVPRSNESNSDSLTEPPEPSEPLFNADRGEQNVQDHREGTAKEVPEVPHVPQPDCERVDLEAEPWRNVSTVVSEVRRCPGCGSALSVLLRSGLCGRCRQWGVVPEWAALVARRTRA